MKDIFSTGPGGLGAAGVDLSTPRDPGTPAKPGAVEFVAQKPVIPKGKRWDAKLSRLVDASAPNASNRFAAEAHSICHRAGLPSAARAFVERMLALEARLAHFESIFPAGMLREYETLAGKELPARETAAFAAPRGR